MMRIKKQQIKLKVLKPQGAHNGISSKASLQAEVVKE